MKNEDTSVHIGEKHNYLTIKKFDHFDKCYRLYYLCQCKCGNEKIIRYDHIISGGVQSCGCMIKKNHIKKHGLYCFNGRLAKSWQTMLYRCENKKNTHYKDYGGRGIKVCSEWHNAKNFMNWALENGYKDNLTIDRIDVNGDYCPENCRWITQTEQMKNKRANHYILFCGEKKCLAEWLRQFDKSDTMFYYWKKKGLSDEQCLERMRNE